MEGSPPLFPALFLVLFLGVTFVWRAYVVRRETGVNPFVPSRRDDAEGVVARGFAFTLALLVVTVGLYPFGERVYVYLAPIGWLEQPATQLLGALLLLASFVWIVVAQVQMGRSFRVGIDTRSPTALVERGLFACSRNPIFLGMRGALLGFFLLLPGALTLLSLILGDLLMQVQVRLEEAHLLQTQGSAYRDYQRRVRRWL